MAQKLAVWRIIDHRQSRRLGWKNFLAGILMPAILFIPGLLANSAAMQWAAFVVLLFMMLLLSVVLMADTMTLDEAQDELNRLRDRKPT